jgi:hypothetical protein
MGKKPYIGMKVRRKEEDKPQVWCHLAHGNVDGVHEIEQWWDGRSIKIRLKNTPCVWSFDSFEGVSSKQYTPEDFL